MSPKIGIPRALLYYYYYPLWRTFFEELGAEVIVSSPSTKEVLARGLEKAVDEICLPVKIAYGHVLDLAGKADFIFLPRIVSVRRREYICPKFLGFPDIIRRIGGLPPLLDVNINLYRDKKDSFRSAVEVGRLFTGNPLKIWSAYRRAVKTNKKYFRLLQLGLMPEEALAVLEKKVGKKPPLVDENGTVALIGHPYILHDPYISMNITGRLRSMGAAVVTAEGLSGKTIRKYAARLPKKLFWTLGQRLIGAAYHYLENSTVKGMVHVAAFGCGLDSITGELIERRARAAGMPFLNITVDEHTGEAGIITRLEAFMDMAGWKAGGRAACSIR
ncbi:MAG TPA: acyl-CoA dehydratase activase-related protein [Bacillota bacterium]|nr:acyl-CoA dehydratase activase-related protein [Bacillota bacterium]